MRAASEDRAECVRLLLAAGADMAAKHNVRGRMLRCNNNDNVLSLFSQFVRWRLFKHFVGARGMCFLGFFIPLEQNNTFVRVIVF
jgi:hypothetical protein